MTLNKCGLHATPILQLYGAVFFAVFCVNVDAVQEPLLDPTRPISYASEEAGEKTTHILQAIFLRESGHQAVIDGRLLDIGDVIGSMKVKSIRRNKVLLTDGAGVLELQLRPTILTTTESEE